jgi:hypothetical protein
MLMWWTMDLLGRARMEEWSTLLKNLSVKPNLIKVTLLLLYSFAGASYLGKFTCFKPKRNEVATADHFLEEQLQWSPRAVACQVFLSGEIPLPMATARPLFVLYEYIGDTWY